MGRMGNDEAAAALTGFVDDGGRDVDTEQYAGAFGTQRTDLHTCIVPGFLERCRCEVFDG